MKGVFTAYFVALFSCVWLQANGVAESRQISEMTDQGDTPFEDNSDVNRIPDLSCYQESCSYGKGGCEYKYNRTCEMEEPRCIEGAAGYEKGDPSEPFPACCPTVICRDGLHLQNRESDYSEKVYVPPPLIVVFKALARASGRQTRGLSMYLS